MHYPALRVVTDERTTTMIIRTVMLSMLALSAVGCDLGAAPEPAPPPVPEEPPADELEAQLRAVGQEVAGWMTRSGPPYRGELAEGAVRDVSHVMQPGWCYKVVGLGGEGVEDLDLRIFDGNDALVQRDNSEAPQAILGRERPICPSVAASYRIEVRARRGAGPFAIQVHRSL